MYEERAGPPGVAASKADEAFTNGLMVVLAGAKPLIAVDDGVPR